MKINTLIALTLALAVSLPSIAFGAQPEEKRMSLNPYGSFLDNGAFFIASQSDGPLVMGVGTPEFSHGFTIPNDYAGGPIGLELLVASPASGCVFDLRHNFVFHNRAGHVGPIGTDLKPLWATAPYLADNQGILWQAPAPGERTVLLRWEFSEHESPFYPGDGINFGLFRAASADHQDDTCAAALHVGGMSIIYETERSGGNGR